MVFIELRRIKITMTARLALLSSVLMTSAVWSKRVDEPEQIPFEGEFQGFLASIIYTLIDVQTERESKGPRHYHISRYHYLL
jgi:hypothetical protein